jgi:hypothetical protein
MCAFGSIPALGYFWVEGLCQFALVAFTMMDRGRGVGRGEGCITRRWRRELFLTRLC